MNYPLNPALQQAIDSRLKVFETEQWVKRLWQKDPTLWSPNPQHQEIVRNRLGWLTLVDRMKEKVDELEAFADELVQEGYHFALILGMGGSSLTAEILSKTFGSVGGYLQVKILDSTDPAMVQAVEREIDLDETVFIVSSK